MTKTFLTLFLYNSIPVAMMSEMKPQIDTTVPPPIRPPRAKRQLRVVQYESALSAMNPGDSMVVPAFEDAKSIRAWMERRGWGFASKSEGGAFRVWRMQ